uniref:dihydrofolate reductase n=1 Tax=Klebsiella pneumoniae TaxID=573 RepID=A0A8B0SPH8_KLEPN|nr:Aminoglycoside 3''-nucleotidyltransferase [Klebsiella pneumoniae]
MACYDCFFVQSMPRASKQQARYAVGRCLMLWSSNDVTQQGSRPKNKVSHMNSESVRIYLVAAMGANRVIGNGPNIPWKIPGEQKIFFADSLREKVVVMGRKDL